MDNGEDMREIRFDGSGPEDSVKDEEPDAMESAEEKASGLSESAKEEGSDAMESAGKEVSGSSEPSKEEGSGAAESAETMISGSAESAEEAIPEPEESEKENGSKSADTGTKTEKKRMPRRRKILLIILLVIAAALAAAYLVVGFYFTRHYLPETEINGVDASYQTVEEVQQEITERVNGYQITISVRGGGEETVAGSEIGLVIEFDETLSDLLADQKSFAWIANLQNEKTFDPERLLSYDEELLASTVGALSFMDEESMTVSEDAALIYNEETAQFEVTDAVFGTWLEAETVQSVVGAAVLELTETLDLEEAGCYTDPVYTEESEEVIAAYTEINELLDIDISYDMEDAGTVSVSKDAMSLWFTVSDTMEVTIDEEAVAAYVADFAAQYDTQYTTHTLATSYGSTVTISGGNYGWKIDQEAETAQLIEELEAKEDVAREPNYSSRAASHAGNDYGTTYVEVNITAQHLYFYKNGSLVIESDFVSGNVSKGYDTVLGIYGITYKEKDATLNGEDYSTPVSYWMPFYGGYGLHDATWRSSFGGTIYKTNGSHGCINLPLSVAKTIFENISTNDPVIVYTLAGTEQSSKASSSSSSDSDEEEEEDEEETEETDETDGETEEDSSGEEE